MTGWLIALGILVLIAILPVGGMIRYDESGVEAKLILGPVKILLFPRPKKKKQKKDKSKKKTAKKKSEPEGPPPGAPVNPNPKKKGGRLTDFLPLVQVALDMLGSLRRKIRVNELQLHLTMAADDPCDLAVNYGRAQAAGATLIAQLERLFVIKHRDVQIQCDFTADEMKVLARLDLTITIGRIISLAVVYGIRALTTYFNIKKQREGGASN